MIRQSGGAPPLPVSILCRMRHYHLFETKLGLCGHRVER